MVSYINMFLKAEITLIPGLLDKYVGNYYNNTLCNGATWMFFIWTFLHYLFDDFLNALLRRMRFKTYVRVRLQQSLWYIDFYSTACIYCLTTLLRNDIKLISIAQPFDCTKPPSGHLILGFIMVLTFYLHSALWEKLKYNNGTLACNYLCLSFVLCFSYFLRFVEGVFRLTLFISSTQVALEVVRCMAVVKWDDLKRRVVLGTLFFLSIIVYIVNYLIVVPTLFGFPLATTASAGANFLFICLTGWLTFELYTSVLVKTVLHWVYHPAGKDTFSCQKDIFECSLFPPRCDATYNFLILRKEMIEREQYNLSLRKPKGRNVVFQTLKCMVAIKRKLHEKRQDALSLSPDADDNPLATSTNKNTQSCEDEEVVGGKLEFNINSSAKYKQE